MRGLVVGVALLVAGCGLAYHPLDGPGERAGKIAARIPLAFLTGGVSESFVNAQLTETQHCRSACQRTCEGNGCIGRNEHCEVACN
ncbi:MAG TPA: hypothetical protein VKA21_17065 [Candidatus Binatia bacterium]|nr:hypothetical protein [Candidatus Binatia bacterium]